MEDQELIDKWYNELWEVLRKAPNIEGNLGKRFREEIDCIK